MAPASDWAILPNDAGAADADERGEHQLLLTRVFDEVRQHLDQPLHRLVSVRFVSGVAPKFGPQYFRLRQVGTLLEHRINDSGTNVGAADINADDAVMAWEHPGRR